MKKVGLSCKVNGREVDLEIQPDTMLVDLLRDTLRLTGTKEGCREGECGACTVLLDGLAVNSCLIPALKAQGKSVVTIEGLAKTDGQLDNLQQHFVAEGAVQCGFCTPGMILNAKSLLDRMPDPDDKEIRNAISGVLCRCTGYQKIVEAVKAASHDKEQTPQG
jgi:carbon-monoxide dehydrogenase small subunit